MIDRLDPHHPLLQQGLVHVQVPEELELRCRRPDDEDLPGVAELCRDVVEEAVRVVGMIVLGRPTLGVAMDVTERRADHRLVEACGVDVENARLVAVDPHGCLAMGGHGQR